MGMVSTVGRKRWSTRLLLASITLLLVLGSLTMLYPFGLMLAGSTKSTADIRERTLLPSFLVDQDALWRKHVEGLFNESIILMRCTYNSTAPSFDRLPPMQRPNEALADEWRTFLLESDFPPFYFTVGYLEAATTKKVLPEALRELRGELSRQFDGDLYRLNRAMGTEFTDWGDVRFILPQYFRRTQTIGKVPINAALDDFMQRQSIEKRVYFSIEGFFREQFLRPQFPDIQSYNAHHSTAYRSYDEVRLPRTIAECDTDPQRQSWELFVRGILNPLWIRATPEMAEGYRAYLRAKYREISHVNENYQKQFASFDEVPAVTQPPLDGLASSDWLEFLQGWHDPESGETRKMPIETLHIHSIDFAFRDHLESRYEDIQRLNARLQANFTDFSEVPLPQEDLHLLDFQKQTSSLRWEFVQRNYITVMDYIAFHGRAIWNTVVYCALAIAAALIVNPLAAYALSRYRPPSTYKLLLIMMLTMAFPPMVTQIPVFLMLRDFGLLNTYWALILPGLANGYSIFLLKGFFDSLPRELYESATIDGASEMRIFWQITMSLSKPILAVLALGAFTTAYANFMFALLICQDQEMWTLMVWLYQLQSRASQGVVLASVTLAAIPTLVVFVLCQRVIMRGIVVPVEK